MVRHLGLDRAFLAVTLMGSLFVKGVERVLMFAAASNWTCRAGRGWSSHPGTRTDVARCTPPGGGVVIAGDALLTYTPARTRPGLRSCRARRPPTALRRWRHSTRSPPS